MRNLATTALERVIEMNLFHEGYLSGLLGYFRFTYAPFFSLFRLNYVYNNVIPMLIIMKFDQ